MEPQGKPLCPVDSGQLASGRASQVEAGASTRVGGLIPTASVKKSIALVASLPHKESMLAKVCSAAVNGIEAYSVEVEVNAGFGDTLIVIVGLPDAAVKESRDRVTTALTNSGFTFTFGRTTINLAPADVKKEGPSFDLPIAIGMAAASEQMESDQLDNFVMVGELALDGAVRMVKGVLSIALRAREQGKVGILVPPENAAEAAVVAGLQVIPVRNLREAVGFLEGEVKIPSIKVDTTRIFEQNHEDEFDFAGSKARSQLSAPWRLPPPAAITCSYCQRYTRNWQKVG